MESSRKRKPPPLEEAENEEEKMNQFFAILQGLQEARDRLINQSSSSLGTHMGEDHKGKKVKLRHGHVSVRMPSFRREDFMPLPREREKLIGPSTQKGKEVAAIKEDEEVKEAIDLRLSL